MLRRWLLRWQRARHDYDCNSQGIIDFLYANGYKDAAVAVENIFPQRYRR